MTETAGGGIVDCPLVDDDDIDVYRRGKGGGIVNIGGGGDRGWGVGEG